jgi:hypothetical protein
MNTRAMRSLWLAPMCLVASMVGSLLTVWALSSLAGFSFNPSVVAVLSATVCAAAVAVSRRHKAIGPGVSP